MFVKGERLEATATTAPRQPASHSVSLHSNAMKSQKSKNSHLEKSTSMVLWPFDKAYHLLVSECDRNTSGAGQPLLSCPRNAPSCTSPRALVPAELPWLSAAAEDASSQRTPQRHSRELCTPSHSEIYS